MEYEIRQDAGVTILNLSGEIDVGCASHFRKTIMNLIEQDAERLLVNLSDVIYIDSAGLSVLIAAHRKAQKENRKFGLCNPQQPVRQVFNITGVNKVMLLYPNVEAGIHALSKA